MQYLNSKQNRVRHESKHIRIIAAYRSDVNREWFDSNFIIHLGTEPWEPLMTIGNDNQ